MNYIVSSVYDGKTRKLFLRKCLKCSIDFYAPKHRDRRFCSATCNGLYKRTRVLVICRQCNKEIEKKRSSLSSSKHKVYFCSRACKDVGQSLKSNCPEIRPPHYGSLKEYRGRIKLDKCVGCGENRRFLLMTHHIDSDRQNNVESNLECVCHNCHVIRHLYKKDKTWIYSTKVLTDREQLSQFYGPIAHLEERNSCKVEATGA